MLKNYLKKNQGKITISILFSCLMGELAYGLTDESWVGGIVFLILFIFFTIAHYQKAKQQERRER